MTAAAPTSAERGMRPEIQALRAIAVGSVLLFHLWPKGVTGGYVGVDVFFVISGFLITGQLVRDLEATGRVRLGRFWARRARRLLPASLLVLAVVAVLTMTVAPLSERTNFFGHIFASTFYVENWALAHQSVDYMASGNTASPVQHYWSLGVEEQFYLVTPLLLLVLTVVLARTRRRLHVVALPVFGLLAGISLWWSISQTATNPGPAYFSTFTRAWEFLLGAMLSVVVLRGNAWVRRAWGWAGAAAIVWAVVAYAATTAFPSYTAALPALGAVAVIAAGGHGPVALLARLRPVTWIGDISYAIYLWHWPLIVLLPYALKHPLATSDRLGIGCASIGIAWVSTRFVETPLRHRPRRLDGVRPLLAVAVAAAVATAAVATLVVLGKAQAQASVSRLQAQSQDLLKTDLRCLGANVVLGRGTCPDYGSLLVPDPAAARTDDGNETPCWNLAEEITPRFCAAERPTHPTLRVLAIGDSHNGSLIPAYRGIAKERHWSLDIAGKAGCSWSTGATAMDDKTQVENCRQWKTLVTERLNRGAPYDLILTTARSRSLLYPVGNQTAQQTTVLGFSTVWAEQIARGSTVIAIDDVPQGRGDVVDCVERVGPGADTQCANPLADALAGTDQLANAVKRTPGSALVNLTDLFCRDDTCLPIVGNVVVYRDHGHVTKTFAMTLVPILGRRIDEAFATLRR